MNNPDFSVRLPVIAKDRGHPSLSSSSTIYVTLIDVNDNAPHFSQTSYDLYIAENSPSGSVVGTISAHDADEGDNSRIEFRIFGGTDAKLFDLEVDEDQPGVVRIMTRTEFDYEAKTNKFYLEVQASRWESFYCFLNSRFQWTIKLDCICQSPCL